MHENNLSGKAYKILEELMVTLKLEPSKTYSEKDLISLTQIGRTPLREALLKLSSESLITIIPRRGIEISDINMANQLSILDTRKVLDTLLISRATRNATSFEKEKILMYKSRLKETVEKKDVIEFLKVDKQLDQLIFDTARNKFAANATNPLHTRSRRFWYYFKGKDDLENSACFHIKLIDKIVASDEEGAIEVSNEIIDSLVQVAKKYMRID